MVQSTEQKWRTEKLADICDVEYGTRVVNKRDSGNKYSVYGGGGATFFMDEYNREDRMVIARFAMSKQCTRFVKGKFFLNDSGLTASPKNIKEINFSFLDLQLYFLNDRIYSLARGAAQKNLDVTAFRNMEISYPESITEQLRIVKILDEVLEKTEKAKENAEKNLQNVKDLFESYLQSVFANPGEDWKAKKLGEIVKTTQGVQITKNLQIKNTKIGYKRYLYISDFNNEKNLKYVEDKYPAKIVSKNDLIVVNTGASAGKIFRGIDGILSNNLFKVSFDDKILASDFIYYFVTSDIFKKFQEKIVRGTANPHMGHENFNATPIFLPLFSEQKFIVIKFDAFSSETKKLEAIYKQKLADLEELKKSVLKKAFNGEL